MGKDVLLYIEQRAGEIRRITFEALTIAKQLAGDDGQIEALLSATAMTELQSEQAAQLLARGIHQVHIMQHEDILPYRAESELYAFKTLFEEKSFDYILLGHTSIGRELAPRIAAHLKIGYISDIIHYNAESSDKLIFTRPLYAGKAFEQRMITDEQGCVITVRPNNIAIHEASTSREQCENDSININSKIQQHKLIPPTQLTRVRGIVQRISGQMDLTEADIIIAGGRGVRGVEGFTLLQQLADELGGAVGASRAACDAGYCDYALQIGQTGKVVTPQLYIACGISGAIQHLAGMNQSRTIVAINKDAEAPIFSIADYGIVGDLFEVIPLLIEELKKSKINTIN